MRFEEWLALRLVIRAVLPLLLIGGAALSATYYHYGPTPRFFALLLGVPLSLVICARLVIRWRAVRPSADGASRLGTPLKRRVQGAFVAIRRARRRRRVRHVELAASEAAKREELLSPERVRTAAEALFRLVHLSSRARDRSGLATLLDPQLLAEWEQLRARSGDANEPHEVLGDIRVEYVGFTTGERPEDVRVVVLIEATLGDAGEDRRPMHTESGRQRVCQYCTLGVRDALFTVAKIDERSDGGQHLAEPAGAPATAGG